MTLVNQHKHIEIKSPRKRATKQEMKEREDFVIQFAQQFGPVTVGQMFNAAT